MKHWYVNSVYMVDVQQSLSLFFITAHREMPVFCRKLLHLCYRVVLFVAISSSLGRSQVHRVVCTVYHRSMSGIPPDWIPSQKTEEAAPESSQCGRGQPESSASASKVSGAAVARRDLRPFAIHTGNAPIQDQQGWRVYRSRGSERKRFQMLRRRAEEHLRRHFARAHSHMVCPITPSSPKSQVPVDKIFLYLIFQHLDLDGLSRAVGVCRQWRDTVAPLDRAKMRVAAISRFIR